MDDPGNIDGHRPEETLQSSEPPWAPTPGAAATGSSGSQVRQTPAPPGTRLGDLTAGDWTVRVVDLIEDRVAFVHDTFINRILLLTRIAVYGMVVTALIGVIGVVTAVMFIRLSDSYLFPHQNWITDLGVGALFAASGAVLWALRGRGAKS